MEQLRERVSLLIENQIKGEAGRNNT